MITPFLINPDNTSFEFPDVSLALDDPNGLLAVGGDLSPQRLLNAYRHGIFPWFNPGEPILWWSPDPRAVLFPGNIIISRSLGKTLKKTLFSVTVDQAFNEVMAACQAPRVKQRGTWITAKMRLAYNEMHRRGYAHSIECWQNTVLVGGLYGMAIGRVFFGESMFSKVNDASKVALVVLTDKLMEWDYQLIDCQVQSEHLISLGAETIPRGQFCAYLNQWCQQPVARDAWNNEHTAK
ncbi:MAG TPA: leucyl/phenylalanyl-tRNA--protein transferase [Gammaproteobacteria bacterium]